MRCREFDENAAVRRQREEAAEDAKAEDGSSNARLPKRPAPN